MINKKGFTLFELLTVCAIIGIMTVVILVSQKGARDRSTLESTSRGFSALIKELQNNALSGKQIGTSGTVVCGYGFTITPAGASTYSLYYNSYTKSPGTDCSSAPTKYDSSRSSIYTTGSFGNNVVGANAAEAYFTIPDASSNLYNASGNAVSSLSVNLSLNSNTYPICLYSSGRIEEPGIGGSCP